MSAGERDAALLVLLHWLSSRDYRFTTVTPLTQSRVLARHERRHAQSLADIFGWSLPFTKAFADHELLALMQRAGVLISRGGLFRSSIRVSSLAGGLFAHSAYPTSEADAVFFGPDTVRFAAFVMASLGPLRQQRGLRCVDVGCGSGSGAITAAPLLPDSRWLLTDINPEALRLAAINARHADVAVETLLSDVLASTDGGFDLVICNPPYLADAAQRAYRHGGGALGRELSLRIVAEASSRLNPGGCLLLYTGVAIVDGVDGLLEDLRTLFAGKDCEWQYAEIDPDVFGEELEQPAYAQADRIAAVGLRLVNSKADTAE